MKFLKSFLNNFQLSEDFPKIFRQISEDLEDFWTLPRTFEDFP